MGRLPPHASRGGFDRQRRSPGVDCNGTLRRGGLDGARLPAQLGRARAGGTIPRERTAPPIRVWPRPVTATLGSVFECRAGHVGVWLSSARHALPASKQREAVFNGWTRKEAYLKATSEGLTDDLPAIEVTLVPGQKPRLLRLPAGLEAARQWAIQDIPLPPDFAGAVAFEKRIGVGAEAEEDFAVLCTSTSSSTTTR